MNRQQLKAAASLTKARRAYRDYAGTTMHPSNEHATAKKLYDAENKLIAAYLGDDPLWVRHDNRRTSLSCAVKHSGLAESIENW